MPTPTELCLHTQSRELLIQFDDGVQAKLPCEYLRVYSPSAEVRGHSPQQAVLQVGKEQVNIERIEPVGNYAVRLVFSDGHNTGLYTWEYLYQLSSEYEQRWQAYLAKLSAAGYTRQPD